MVEIPWPRLRDPVKWQSIGDLAQLVRALLSHSRGRRFESYNAQIRFILIDNQLVLLLLQKRA